MKITFTYQKKSIPCDITPGQRARLYAVPAEYSDDGFYLAYWSSREHEPVPSSAAISTKLLADVACSDDGKTVDNYIAKGVKYA